MSEARYNACIYKVYIFNTTFRIMYNTLDKKNILISLTVEQDIPNIWI